MEIPTEWPNKIKKLYEPIRMLGKGGFASVVLARNKKNNKQQQQQTKVAIKVVGCAANDNDDDNNSNDIQAIAAASLYAQREIEILKQIDHPNIVKLFNHWIAGVDDDDDDDNNGDNGDNTSSLITKTAAVLVLEYVKGPTVESLLRYGGALSTVFGRIIIAQMMDAVSYLHYHAVLHRDIKPDNILVSGAISNDDTIWDNPNNNANNSNNNNNNNDDNDELDEQCHHHHSSYSILGGTTTSTAKYRELLLKWKVTIIDFGFARALTPNDVEKPSQENRLKHSKNASYHDIYNINSSNSSNNNNNNNKSKNYTDDELSSSSSKRLRQRISRGILNVLDVSFHRDSNDLSSSQRSATHKIKRTMSTLGNRNYAAPEIINKVRPRNHREEKKKKEEAEQKRSTIKVIATATGATSSHGTTATAAATASETNTAMTTETISNYVADYGLLVDSYSMGHTIRYMMTGVQPGTSIDDAIQKQKNIENGLLCCRKLLFCLPNKNKKQPQQQPQKRSVRYRQTEDLPGEVYILIRSLTELSQRNRISIRKARRTVPWINDVFLSSSQQQQEQQLSLSLSNKEDDNSNNNSNNDDDERKKEQPQNIISTLPTTTTTMISTPSSHYAVSEEQLHSLNQICYLSLGTAAIEIVAAASNHTTTTSPTKLDTDTDTSINTNTHTSTSTSIDKTSIVQIDTDDITTTEQTIAEQQHDETLMF